MSFNENDLLKVSTWNILGDGNNQQDRLELVAAEINDFDICAIQEVVFTNPEKSSAHDLSSLSGLQIVSLIPTETNNFVSGEPQATAVLSSLPVVESNIVLRAPLEDSNGANVEPKSYAGAILQSNSTRKVFIASVHLPWGGNREYRRLKHIRAICTQIDEIMKHLPDDSIAILAGDFNSTPNSDTVRFLTGELAADDSGAFWVDAWSAAGIGDGYTFDPQVNNLNIIRTANKNRIYNPAFMPKRRLDYIFVRGWAYGRPGSPLTTSLIGESPGVNDLHASDHYGICSNLWDPVVSTN